MARGFMYYVTKDKYLSTAAGGKIREGIDVENETYDVDSVVFSIAKKKLAGK